MTPTIAQALSYAHLSALTDGTGLFEHAEYDAPRREHGYCVDDVARALIVVAREPAQTPELAQLTETYLRFLERALQPDGRSHNRMSASGVFTDEPATSDWWGRATWAFGELCALARTADHRQRARHAFQVTAAQRSLDLRAMAFAGLGAAAILRGGVADGAARALLDAAASAVGAAQGDGWIWPEDRLRYANAALPHVLIAAGAQLGRRDHLERGLALLRFLLQVETVDGHLSLTGTRGRGADEIGQVMFDQQPIEAAAIADACACAFEVTADPAWLVGLETAWRWFAGGNDVGIELIDPATGAGYDGLHAAGRNENRGAESTLSALTTWQLARRFGVLD